MEGKFVDVWQGSLSVEPEIMAGMLGSLSETEQQKAAAFKLPVMRQRYITVRFLLRNTLANYLQTKPRALQFQVDSYGKPFLACGSLHFNISHTADILMIAVANFADIGIDVEVIKPRGSLDSLAARCFSMRELHDWQQLPPEHRSVAFYSLWTKKEAFVKAVGRGIGLGLEQCEVDLQSDGQLRAIPAEYGLATDWKITELSIDPSARAALANRNCKFSLRHLMLVTALEA
ncbi:MAG: 4'-phosphopantetheinyl transferase superfamily protein [Methylomonas sp.]|uniref:4'-phosphopantetheinyl transferase family protein n=1 Tax=Methylomonas sp. TaxID=418 RepID=UPI0025ED5DF0|nr:4'-phosphopantetheinyl transferase superfamily protein [Methylomonas sp.]MCK9609130.1 4'-phosphopantetheinyl transferase superfamily protein [Methylomonas sp.]